MRVNRVWITARPARRGATVVIVAILAFFLLGLLCLSLDFAYVRLTAQQLQAAADAGALAGAERLKADNGTSDFRSTRQSVIDCVFDNEAARASVLVTANSANDPAGDVVVGRWDRRAGTFTPTTIEPDAVRVTARRTDTSPGGRLDLVFGAIFGNAQSDIQRAAIAHLGAAYDPVILILDRTANPALDIRGNATIEAPDGTIHINSSAGCGLRLNGAPNDPRIIGESITVVGDYCIPTNSAVPEPLPDQDYVSDPYASLPYPVTAGMPNHGGISRAGTYDPGYYPRGMSFNRGTAVLRPGVYVVGPPGVNLNGSGHIDGAEVMLFLDLGAKVTLAGNNVGFDITPPTSGIYRGMSIFQHRDNRLPFDISGDGNLDIGGALYLPSAHFDLNGNVDRSIGRIIANTMSLRGNGHYLITGEGPPPTGPRHSFLVD